MRIDNRAWSCGEKTDNALIKRGCVLDGRELDLECLGRFTLIERLNLTDVILEQLCCSRAVDNRISAGVQPISIATHRVRNCLLLRLHLFEDLPSRSIDARLVPTLFIWLQNPEEGRELL